VGQRAGKLGQELDSLGKKAGSRGQACERG
jgi:hypothetical protein